MFLYNKLSIKEGQTKIKHACYLSQTKIKHVISLYFIQLCVKESQTKTKHVISLYVQLGISLVCFFLGTVGKKQKQKQKQKTRKQLSFKPCSTCIRKKKQVHASRWSGQDGKRCIITGSEFSQEVCTGITLPQGVGNFDPPVCLICFDEYFQNIQFL
jgi:hypothetical protein